jgi:hypothetical protein
MSSQQALYDSVPVGFRYAMPDGRVIEKRSDGVYIDGQPMKPGPYHGCDTATDYRRRAAEITNAHRRGATAERIKAAQAELLAAGQRPTVAALARLARVSRQAIYKHHSGLLEKVSTTPPHEA